jgi:predicted DNA-binding protein
MGAMSVRLPDEPDTRLTLEAELEGKPRSELAREAIAHYLAKRERARFMEELVAEARAGYSDAVIRREAQVLAEDFLPVENEALDRVEDRAAGTPAPDDSDQTQRRDQRHQHRRSAAGRRQCP